ncbi:MAG: DUF3892 domain-containing protein [Nitrososphaera sp.]
MAVNIDYVISAVRRAKSKKQIDSVKQHRLYGSSVGQGEEASRQQAISNIDAGMIYYTITFSKGRYALGERVIKYAHGNTDYIRTDNKRIASDSLGNLPTF